MRDRQFPVGAQRQRIRKFSLIMKMFKTPCPGLTRSPILSVPRQHALANVLSASDRQCSVEARHPISFGSYYYDKYAVPRPDALATRCPIANIMSIKCQEEIANLGLGHGNRYLLVYILINFFRTPTIDVREEIRSPMLSVPRPHGIANIICAPTPMRSHRVASAN